MPWNKQRYKLNTMQYFTSNGILLIGKHKGKLFLDLPKQYFQWAKKNLPDFREQHKTVSKLVRKLPSNNTGKQTSSNGSTKMSNKVFSEPNNKRFTSKAIRAVNYATSDT
jgi:hypothetical protein